jgi:hypothetical protein
VDLKAGSKKKIISNEHDRLSLAIAYRGVAARFNGGIAEGGTQKATPHRCGGITDGVDRAIGRARRGDSMEDNINIETTSENGINGSGSGGRQRKPSAAA